MSGVNKSSGSGTSSTDICPIDSTIAFREMWLRVFKMYSRKPYYNKLYKKVYNKVHAVLDAEANQHIRGMGFCPGSRKGDDPVIGTTV